MTHGLQGDFARWGNLKKASVPIAQRQSVYFWRPVLKSPAPLRSGRLLQSATDLIDDFLRPERQTQKRPPNEAASSHYRAVWTADLPSGGGYRLTCIRSALPQLSDIGGEHRHVAEVPILLQKSFCTADQKFSGL